MEEVAKKLAYDLREAGAHWHDDSAKDTLVGGTHNHLLDDYKTVLHGGDHSHDTIKDMVAGTEGKLDWGGEHVHEALLPDGTRIMAQPVTAAREPGQGPTPVNTAGGRHQHELTPDMDAGRSGQHVHKVGMPDGSVRETLGHDEIKALIEKRTEPGTWDSIFNT